MIIKKSVMIWTHVPSLDEIRRCADPDKDLQCASFEDGIDISLYLDYTGLRIYHNGSKNSPRYKSEYKYIVEPDGSLTHPEYTFPAREQFILT